MRKPTINQTANQVAYVVPSDTVIEEFARHVCQHLRKAGKQYDLSTAMMYEFASFLKTVAHIQAKRLNQTQATRRSNAK